MPRSFIVSPELEGQSFFWEGGPVGILLVHGLTATTAEVRMLGRCLNEEGYTISGPLLPGHYSHPQDLNRVRWEDWVSCVNEAYHKLRESCQTVFVGGESTGALLCLHLAARQPEISGILSFAAALRLALRPFEPQLMHLLALLRPWVPKKITGPSPNWQGYSVNPLRGALQLLELQKVVEPMLPAIHQPILIGQGRLDTTVDSKVPMHLYENIGSKVKEIHWFEHSRHTVIIDRELPLVLAKTLAFLDRVQQSD